ncbi:MAG: tetratricopeptide repeat protein [Planctomycetes bacterium]|nr:tetratricopeptide repeat protein [Planctomycetota bacterium]
MHPFKNNPLPLLGLIAASLLPSCGDTQAAPAPPVVSSLGRLLPAIQKDLNEATAKVLQDPDNWALWAKLGVRYEINSTYGPALECYGVAAGHLPTNALWPYRAAITAGRTDDPELALLWIERSIKIDAKYPTSHYRKGNWLLEMGRLEEAQQAYQRASELGPKNSETWAGLARVALQDDAPERALELIKKARKLKPSDAYLHLLLGITLSQLGRESEAEAHLTLGQNSSPSVMDPWSRVVSQGQTRERDLVKRAKAMEAKGDFSGAIRAYREVIKARPNELKLPLRLASTLLKAKRPDEALVLVQETLERYPTHIDLLLFQGALLQKQGDSEGAWNSCQRALAAAPDRPAPYIFQSGLFAQTGKSQEAIAAARMAIDKAPMESRGYETLAQRYGAAQAPWDAVRIMESALNMDGFKPSVRFYQMLLKALKALKRPDKLAPILKRAQADYGTNTFPN